MKKNEPHLYVGTLGYLCYEGPVPITHERYPFTKGFLSALYEIEKIEITGKQIIFHRTGGRVSPIPHTANTFKECEQIMREYATS